MVDRIGGHLRRWKLGTILATDVEADVLGGQDKGITGGCQRDLCGKLDIRLT